jgi:hypothetical protein
MSIPVNATLPWTASDEEAAGVEAEAAGVDAEPVGVEALPVGVEVLPVGVEVPASEAPGTDSVCEVAEASLSGALESPGFWHDASKSAAERIKTCERLFFIKNSPF